MNRSRRMQALLGNQWNSNATFTASQKVNEKTNISDSRESPDEAESDANINSFAQLTLDGEADNEVFSQSDDDEKILNIDHTVGGRYAPSVERNEVGQRHSNVPTYNLKFGEEIDRAETFCHLSALVRFPYDHMSKAHRNRVAKKYFEKGQVYERDWDFFYIYPPSELGTKFIILIPTTQVEQFLHKINLELRTYLRLPEAEEYPAFSTTFTMEGAPRPRYLGKSTEREMAEGIKMSVPARSWRADDEKPRTPPIPASDRSLETFRKRIEMLMESDKMKKASTKAKKAVERRQKKQGWGKQVKRVERYLGLRESRIGQDEAIKRSLDGSGLEWAAYDEAVQAAKAKANVHIPFTYESPAPYTPEDSVVFICVDVEADEHDHTKITEVGFAILDTADLQGTSPGPQGQNWMKAIRGTHLRTTEYQHIINKDFMNGCPDQFQFGKSQFVDKINLPQEIAKCFRPPYTKVEGSVDEPMRSIVLIGHDIGSDVKFLKAVGYDVHNLSNLQEEMDTSSMYRALEREPNPRNLGSCLANLGLTGWWLHNAGNDAVYTLQVMIAIALKDMARREEDDLKTVHDEQKQLYVTASLKQAEENAIAEQEGWSSEDADDGGVAVPIVNILRKGMPAWSPDSSPKADTTMPLPTAEEISTW